MEFCKSRVYTALDADDLKVGSKCIFANNLDSLRCKVIEGTDIRPIVQILNDSYERRFKTDVMGEYPFAYLVSEPKLTWIVYLCRQNLDNYYLTSCRSDRWEVVQKDYGAKTKLFEGTDDECRDWYKTRKHFTDVIAAWEDGKDIQFLAKMGYKDWEDLKDPAWELTYEYRIKPEPLKWTDLKIGDVATNGTETYMVTGIDTSDEPDSEGDVCHIYMGDCWYTNEELKEWEKVEE